MAHTHTYGVDYACFISLAFAYLIQLRGCRLTAESCSIQNNRRRRSSGWGMDFDDLLLSLNQVAGTSDGPLPIRTFISALIFIRL